MAIAVHTVLSGETLQSIAATYFALQHPDGGSGTTIDDVRQSEVIRAIRSATPTSVFDLSSFLDADTLTTGNAVFVPALRQFNRQIYQDTVHTDLNPNLEALGYDHAGKLMAATSAEVITQLPSASVTYVDADVTRLWVLTQFLTLDGMDLATAEELYDNQSIQSMATLSLQSVASLQSILDSLVTGGKAPELSASAQRHAERWRAEAKLRARQVGGQVSRGKYRMLSIPAAPDEFTKRAVFYEAVADDSRNTRADTTMAGYLARLYRFHGAAVRGNQNVLAGRAEEARKAYMEARREMHRLVEDTGTSSSVDDEVGVNLETVVEAIKVVLQALPPEDDAPFGPPSMVFFNEGRVGRPHYRLRTFTEAELTGGEKNNLRNALTSVATHALPRRYRSALQQVALEKSRAQLDSASVSTGLLAADATALARDLEAQDKEVLRRNIAAASFSTIGSGGLNLADQVSDALVISEVQQLVGALWSGSDAAAIVEDSSPYPTGFLTSLDPFARL